MNKGMLSLSKFQSISVNSSFIIEAIEYIIVTLITRMNLGNNMMPRNTWYTCTTPLFPPGVYIRPRVVPNVRIPVPEIDIIAPDANRVSGDEAPRARIKPAEAVVVELESGFPAATGEGVGVAVERRIAFLTIVGRGGIGVLKERSAVVGVANALDDFSIRGALQRNNRVLIIGQKVEMLGRSPASGEVVTAHLQAVVQVRGAEDILGENLGIGARCRLGVRAALLNDPTAVVEVADQLTGLDVAAGNAPTKGVVPVFPLLRYSPTGNGGAGAGELIPVVVGEEGLQCPCSGAIEGNGTIQTRLVPVSIVGEGVAPIIYRIN